MNNISKQKPSISKKLNTQNKLIDNFYRKTNIEPSRDCPSPPIPDNVIIKPSITVIPLLARVPIMYKTGGADADDVDDVDDVDDNKQPIYGFSCGALVGDMCDIPNEYFKK